MPQKADPPPNGKKPPSSQPIESSQMLCRGCSHPFEHFVLEQIGDLAQLRVGDVIMDRAEIICLLCGRITYWNMKEKDIEKMAVVYGELMVVIKGYNPE
jgi:hypothetical protein